MSETLEDQAPLVGVIIGSKSDWETMRYTDEMLTKLGVPHENRIMSAHRTPDAVVQYATSAESRGIKVIIAGAGLAAALPGVLAAHTTLPVLGVPMLGQAVQGLDSLLSIVQMPPGIPVGTLGLGRPGATNAALLAVAILANSHPTYRQALQTFREEQSEKVLNERLP